MRIKPALLVVTTAMGVSSVVSAQIETNLNKAFPMPRTQLDERAGFAPEPTLKEIVEPKESRLLMQRNQARKQLRPTFNVPAFLAQQKPPNSREVSERIILQLSIEHAEVAEKLGDDHPKVKALRDEIAVMKRILKAKNDKNRGARLQEENRRGERSGEAHELLERAHSDSARRVKESEILNRETQELRDRIAEQVRRLRAEEDHRLNQTSQMEKVHALHEAAERLSASGLEDEAHHLHRRAEEMEEELHHRREHPSEPEPVLHELLEDVELLRREVRETHEKLDRIMEMLRDHEDEDDDEVNFHESESLIRPVWWDKEAMRVREDARRRRLASEAVFSFGGITINR